MPTSPSVQPVRGTQSEQHLVSSIILNKDYRTAVAHNVNRDMFRVCQQEWDFIESYVKTYNQAPSLKAFKYQFPKFTIKEDINDTGYYSDQVRTAHARWLLTEKVNDIADLLAGHDIDTALKTMQQTAVEVAAQVGINHDENIFSDYSDIKADLQTRIRRVSEYGSSGIPTGFPAIDERTSGFQPSEFAIVSARLNIGKSYILGSLACNAALADYTVQLVSLEMSRSLVSWRLHSFLYKKLRNGHLDPAALVQGKGFDVNDYNEFLEELENSMTGRIHISDATRGQVSPLDVAAMIERNHPDIVFIDYLTLMKKRGPDWQAIAELSGQLKQLAVQYNIPIVAAAQLNRSKGESSDPGADALAGSDSIGQDADMVLAVTRESSHVRKCTMVKNRNGKNGFRWYVNFRPEQGVIEQVDYTRAMDIKDQDRVEDAENHTNEY